MSEIRHELRRPQRPGSAECCQNQTPPIVVESTSMEAESGGRNVTPFTPARPLSEFCATSLKMFDFSLAQYEYSIMRNSEHKRTANCVCQDVISLPGSAVCLRSVNVGLRYACDAAKRTNKRRNNNNTREAHRCFDVMWIDRAYTKVGFSPHLAYTVTL